MNKSGENLRNSRIAYTWYKQRAGVMFSNRNMEEQKSSVGITCICPICLSKDRYLDFLDGELRYLTVVLGIFSEVIE